MPVLPPLLPDAKRIRVLPEAIRRLGLDSLLDVLDYLPDTVAFVKDAQGRYLYANRTLLERLNRPASAVLGLQASEVFPASLGAAYTQQDTAVLAGRTLTEHLELHLYPGGKAGWCLTTKRMLGEPHAPVGLLGLSRDLHLPRSHASALGLAAATAQIEAEYAAPLSVPELARSAGLSVTTFERQIRRVYGLTPTQLLTRTRIQAATALLSQTSLSVAQIAVECGYFDHSAFARAFKGAVGLTPSGFRGFVRGSTGEAKR
ncbi:AraC family transcriptional regulator (plasmid) [Deinococcus psychrotolerans]|uniref:AraC family transcriptional regulator n=1 Tax=Deinococcus psychrotolerans TaxID=2489213 RepID=A0A3G8YKM9_9DEIO|nr:AraC family transcriptional regulator [Deinococcus psychrotolerans]AZI44837.1 AraC family transcriptional regulator [Deinococcus psychrotolerans]